MSVQLIAWALEQETGSLTRKAVLFALANAANHHTGQCNPSVSRICQETEAGPTAVKNALTALVDQGLITRQRRRRADGSLSTYEYRFPHVVPASDVDPGTPDGLPGTRGVSSPGTRGVSQEPEVNLEPEEGHAAAPQNGQNGGTERPRNETWDALAAIFGEPTTRSAQKVRGKVCASLRSARASPAEIHIRARRWPQHFDTATLTDLALEKHWDALGRKPLRRQ